MMIKFAAISMAAVLSTASWAQAPVASVGGSGSVNERLAELERSFSARAQAQIDQQRQLNAMQQELSELRGLLEEQSYRLEQVIERQRSMLAAQQEAASAPRAAPEAAPRAEAEPAPSQTAASASPEPAGDEQATYDRAVNLVLQDKDYNAAIPAFARFITQYPQSTYVPNAHYWLGQLLYAQKRFDQSKAQFGRVVEAYPKSNKRADSLLKLGLIAREQKDDAQARQYFEQILSEYGSSSAARLAQENLDAMK
ncbi:tol-pal system protein YbgF [Oceanimonas pelagia]|uniref:Cell division coordinator CpoB n=1 Tax=Oceanimonas pelagia TaxID=3028314 RepID=A0AA50KM12_9GAMM|nr:tol-pal system protein YbgF [Oceanimonas pelagia]WMC09377.1 tol-pal system protein YbgF [Oceanimonas pelagia]